MGGLGNLWLLEALPGGVSAGSSANNIGLLALLAGVGALLPDLDARESRLKRVTVGAGIAPFALPSLVLHRTLGHRGMLHSLIGLVLTALLLGVPLLHWLDWQPALALLLGFGSHLLLDACTKAGVPLLWPDRTRRHLLPARLRFTTGSAAEEALLVPLTLAAVLLFLSVLNGVATGTAEGILPAL
jgi:inner membrane protein